MSDFVHEAGWPIYLVIAASGLSLVAGIQWARAPRAGGARLLGASVLAVLAFGVMGFVLGLDATLRPISDDFNEWGHIHIILCGVRESLHNLALAAVVLATDAVLYFVGCARLGGATPDGGREAAAVPAGI